MNPFIRIYDCFRAKKKLLWISMLSLTAVFICMISRMQFSENISDFLPLGASEQESMSVYQNISGADRIFILFDNPDDEEYTVEAIDYFMSRVEEKDSLQWCSSLTAHFDISSVLEVMDFVYENIPYFLTDRDLERMDSLLNTPGFISAQLAKDKESLLFPAGPMVTNTITRDPLGLFAPVVSKLQDSNPQAGFEMYDGCIFTPDMSRAIAMMKSPFGNSETEYNSRMLRMLHQSIKEMNEEYPEVSARIAGGPEIAVGNSERIKKDSMIAIALSAVLIMLLVIYSIGSVRNILLIFISIGWGWLFAMAGMSLLSDSVSIIVIGISSVILGLAVNYPLHLIIHMSHVDNMKEAIREIWAPLLIGNITTVGAFMTLIPLHSVALHDLGNFAALLLVGTIVFVLLYLPHLAKFRKERKKEHSALAKIAAVSPEKSRLAIYSVIVITIVLAFFSPRAEFDSNIANINYMTDTQRADMQYFQNILESTASKETKDVYVLSDGTCFDEALTKNSEIITEIDSLVLRGLVESYKGVGQFLVSKEEQAERLKKWNSFLEKNQDKIQMELRESAVLCGFSPLAFAPFERMIENSGKLVPEDIEFFEPLTKLVLSGNITESAKTGKAYIVNTLKVKENNISTVKEHFDKSFDITGLNSALSDNLSKDFNYIGWACSVIVFIFLWFSFGRIELAIISFLPMAVSWVWILGIMGLTGIKFNIVNVILATFIFGQGDDYTIFMTEGCQHEYKFRRPILASYKNSILQSALILFVGIGTLIISRHPAMKSLAEVTIIGMISVVLMSYLIPPLIFGWLTSKNGKLRRYPLTITSFFRSEPKTDTEKVIYRYIYKGREINRIVRHNLKEHAQSISEMSIKEHETVEYEDNSYGELSILLALTHPDAKISAHIKDDAQRRIAEISAQDFVSNIEFKP